LPTTAGIATLKALEPNANIALFLNAIGSLVSRAVVPNTRNIALGNDPMTNQPRPSVEIGTFQVQNVRTASNALAWNYRMDWQFTDHDVLTGSALRDNQTITPDNFANPGALPN